MDRTKCEHRKLTELAIITMGQSPDSVSYNNVGDGLPFFQGNADFGALYPTVRVFCNKPTREANKDDVLMSVRAPIGAVNISNIHCCIGRGLCSISPISGLSISKYLYYFLISKRNYLDSIGTGTTFKSIGKKELFNLTIPLISLNNQKCVVAELDKLNDVIALKRKQLTDFDSLAQSLFYEMFGDPVVNEKGWSLQKLETICTHIVDCPHSTPKKADKITQYPCIRTSELKGGNISWDTMQYLEEDEYNVRIARLKPEAGDIVFGREGTIGDAVILPKGYFFSLGQRTMLLRANESVVTNTFLHRVILSEWVKKQIRSVNVSSTVAHVNIKDFKLFKIPVPPLTLQQSFAEKIAKIEAEKQRVKSSLKDLETLLASRMQYWFDN